MKFIGTHNRKVIHSDRQDWVLLYTSTCYHPCMFIALTWLVYMFCWCVSIFFLIVVVASELLLTLINDMKMFLIDMEFINILFILLESDVLFSSFFVECIKSFLNLLHLNLMIFFFIIGSMISYH